MNDLTDSRLIGPLPRRRSNRRVIGSIAIRHVLLALALALAGCAPSTEVLDTRSAPQATKDAMLQVKILPLGTPAPPGVGSIAPVSGYGCAATSEAASGEAIRQLRLKALQMHATAVVDVLVGPAEGVICLGYNMTANGIAVAPRGISPAY